VARRGGNGEKKIRPSAKAGGSGSGEQGLAAPVRKVNLKKILFTTHFFILFTQNIENVSFPQNMACAQIMSTYTP
jgi:hypothetical protein